MLLHSETAQVIGRSMEPVLCEGDLVEVARVPAAESVVGGIYGFRVPGLDRPAAHRLIAKGGVFRFRGDRQPFEESVEAPTYLHEIRRVLDRSVRPEAGSLLFSLLLLEGRGSLRFPRHCTLHWPWKELIELGRKHRLNPFLLHVLKQSGLWELVPGEFQPAYYQAWQEAAQLAPRIESCLRRVRGLLPAATMLKGALLRELYPDPSLRLMEDVDCLVPEAEFPASFRTLESAGFEVSESAREIVEFYTSVSLRDPESGISVDLHKAPFQPRRYAFPSEGFQGELSPEMLFVYLCAHGVQHWGRHGQTILDLHLLWRQRKPDLLQAQKLAGACGAQGAFLFFCSQLRRWLNLPLPDFSDSGIPLSIRLQQRLIDFFLAQRLELPVFSRRRLLLQALVADSWLGFARLYLDPARRKMLEL